MEKFEEIISQIDSHKKKKAGNEIKKYLKRWPWFLLFCVLGVALGYLIYTHSPNVYEVKSRILVVEENPGLNNVLTFDNPNSNPMKGMEKNANMENKIGILQSYTLFRKALMNLNWEKSWYKKELLYKKELYNNEPFELLLPPNALNAQDVPIEIVALNDKKYQISAKGQTNQNGHEQKIDIENVVEFGKPYNNEFFNFTLNLGTGKIGETYYLNFNNFNSLTNQYLKKTDIAIEELESDLITIMIEGENIHKETDFINELNNVFIQFGVENKFSSSNNSLEFIDSQLSRIKTKLQSAENNFSNYRRNNQVMNLSQEAQIIYQKLEEIENEKYMTQLQVDYYKDLQQYLDDSEKISEMVSPSVIGISDANLNNMLSKLMDLYSRREVLSYSVKEESPSFKVLQKEIKITRDALDETLKNQLRASESILQSAEERYTSIESRVRQLPETERELIGIQRDFDLNNELYTYLLQKKAEASISQASIAPEVQVIDPAMIESSTKVGPSLLKNVGIGLMGGLSIPFLFITLIGVFNTKIETREEIEENTQLPVLEGIIRHKYKVKLPVIHHPRSGIAESFRGVKTNLNAILGQPGAKVVSINSLIPEEGKSFIASNFAAILAKTGKKTLLIGSDLHKPALNVFLNVKNTYGLSDYLKGEKNFEEILSSTAVSNLDFIQSGAIPKNPSELLDGPKFGILIEKARALYDYIIIDNAPLMLVPDAILTNNFSDISLFVLRINHSDKKEIKQISKVVDFNKIKRAAILINDAPDRGYGYGRKYWKKGYGEYKHKLSIA